MGKCTQSTNKKLSYMQVLTLFVYTMQERFYFKYHIAMCALLFAAKGLNSVDVSLLEG